MADENEPLAAIPVSFEKAEAEATKIYVNVFYNQIKALDFSIAFFRDGQPLVVLDMSHSVAKSLGQKITAVINQYEKDTGITFPTGDELFAGLVRASKADGASDAES